KLRVASPSAVDRAQPASVVPRSFTPLRSPDAFPHFWRRALVVFQFAGLHPVGKSQVGLRSLRKRPTDPLRCLEDRGHSSFFDETSLSHSHSIVANSGRTYNS
ncbi:MAG: hypothetical protein V3T55_10010, partial [Anaerolineales bacterium]